MHCVFEHLERIKDLLAQIDTITENQTTILLSNQNDFNEENLALDIMEQMVECKESVINELVEEEAAFQKAYDRYKSQLIQSGEIGKLKKVIASIMKMKEEITRKEQQNMLILQNSSRKIEKVRVSPSSQQIVAAYKKQQIKT